MKAGKKRMEMQELKELIYQGEKVSVECKEAEGNVPKSAYESYSAFANTKGGYIILGVKEDKKKVRQEERFVIQGIKNPKKQVEDFWNTINSSKVNYNILKDEDVFIIKENDISLVVIKVPRADYKMRPVLSVIIHIRALLRETMKGTIMQLILKLTA